MTEREVQTRLLWGAVVLGHPHDTDAYTGTAERLGYGADVARMERAREIGR